MQSTLSEALLAHVQPPGRQPQMPASWPASLRRLLAQHHDDNNNNNK